MKKIPEFIQLLREEFNNRLRRKTGWGRNEIKQELEIAINNALARLIGGHGNEQQGKSN